jgi:predicted flap endonuclease-1-like 5' DNA nuclease
MGVLACCLWWFVFGVLVGWLLNWLMSKFMRRDRPAPPDEAPDAHYPVAPHDAVGSRFEPLPPIPQEASFPPAPVAAMPAPAEPSTRPPPSRVIDVGAARSAGFNLKHADDLTIIEGIGPKTDELFRSHGVTGFAQLAQLATADMLAILDQGGPHFKFANPVSWAQQASLAAENRWAELKTLQDELIGGVGPADRH